MSELLILQPTIIKFVQMLSSVLQVDAEVVDTNLVRIAGTGPYNKQLGEKINSSARIFKHIIEHNVYKFVSRLNNDPICVACENASTCNETAFLGAPIILENQCIGVISLVAFTDESRRRIEDNAQVFTDYISHISQIFVSKIIEYKGNSNNIDPVFINLINNMDQGVLVLDGNNKVKHANQIALNKLNLSNNAYNDISITIETLLGQTPDPNMHQQHIISYQNIHEIIVGKFSPIQEYKLFLMSFHQPNGVFNADKVKDTAPSSIIGESKAIRNLKSLITRISKSPSSILIRGESGTGKEVFAKEIHLKSNRSHQPFIAINCAAIPENLLESELFGYIKGAFTGALTKGKVGLIQAANGGTLFLDEIGDMPLQLQAKLLRVLEAREVVPVGSSKAIPVDIRVISATNKDFETIIAEHTFREDLYYRLNVIPLYLPLLKDREGDINLLVHFFLDLHTNNIGVNYPGISAGVIARLNDYHWPGNVRELSNLVEYLVNVVPNGDQIDVDLLPPYFKGTQEEDKSNYQQSHFHHDHMSLEDNEKIKIEDALSRLNNRQLVADELGIGIATLYRKIKKYNLSAIK